MSIEAQTRTLTKAQLLHALATVDDDAKVYVVATRSIIDMALSGAKVDPNDVYLAISASVQREDDGGVSLIADFNPLAWNIPDSLPDGPAGALT